MLRSVWHISPEEIFRTLRGSGGQPFTEFVDALLRATAASAGATPDQVITNVRTNIGDGGVDSRVVVPFTGPMQIEVPSVWQYKATDYKSVTASVIEEEMRKPHARERIEDGDAYIMCVCDDAPAEWKAERAASMWDVAKSLRQDAAKPRLLAAGELADWANRFPSIVLRFFRPRLAACLTWEAWVRQERATFAEYVELTSRGDGADRVREHVTPTAVSGNVLVVSGALGIGKSRFVAESLSDFAPLVVYAPCADAAFELLPSLANDKDVSAIVVVDDCRTSERARLAKLAPGFAERVRLITIADSTDETAGTGVVLQSLNQQELDLLLEVNFKQVAWSYRRVLSDLADGSPKLGALLAAAYQANPNQFVTDAGQGALDILLGAVPDRDDRRALQALSLFPRLGYRGDISDQLEVVAKLLTLDPRDIAARARRLARNPGVVTLGPRYMAVRPRLFCQSLLRVAWNEWLSDDVAVLLDDLPHGLTIQFMRQLATYGDEAHRERVTEQAGEVLRQLTPAALGNRELVERLVALIEVSPTRMAPTFADLVCAATDEDLQRYGGRLGIHESERSIEHAFRDLLGFERTHSHAERALYRMAKTSKNIAASTRAEVTAAGMWASSFRIHLSGTEVPFDRRLAVLSKHLEEDTVESRALVVGALDRILAGHAFRSIGPQLIGGAVQPPDWHPATVGEWRQCLAGALSLLKLCLQAPDSSEACGRVFVAHGRWLLQNGLLEHVRAIVREVSLPERQRMKTLRFVRDFLRYDTSGDDEDARIPTEYVDDVRRWAVELEPLDLAGRLAVAVEATHGFDEAHDLQRAQALAGEFFVNQAELAKCLDWLVTTNGNSEFLLSFGAELGRLDESGALLGPIFECARTLTNPLFLRGYAIELHKHDALGGRLVRAIDELEVEAPMVALDIAKFVSPVSTQVDRAVKLVRQGRLAPSALRFNIPRLPADAISSTLDVILSALADKPEEAAATGLALVFPLLCGDRPVQRDLAATQQLWRLLEVALSGAGAETHVWPRLFRELAESDFEKAVALCCRALDDSDISVGREAAIEFTVLIQKQPDTCIAALGPALLAADPWKYTRGTGRKVLVAFPASVLQMWIEDNGVAAARVVAASLPEPSVGPEGTLELDPLTTFVLERFDEDEEVRIAFAGGRHNGQVYSGDIVGVHRAAAARARPFLSHTFRSVREWAANEIAHANASVDWYEEHDEELFG